MARSTRYALVAVIFLAVIASIALGLALVCRVTPRAERSAFTSSACSVARILRLAPDACQPPRQVQSSCSACPLRLAILNRTHVQQGFDFEADIDFAPDKTWPLPNLADLRVATSGRLQLLSVELGDALQQANTRLVPDSSTGQLWRKTESGAYQFIVLPHGKPKPIQGGSLLRLRFHVVDSESVALWIERRRHKFAPLEAEDVLEMTPYDGKVTVLPP